MRWASALVLGVWLSVGVTATPQDALSRATPESMGLSSAGFLRVSQLLQEYVAARKVPGVVAAVARQGRVVFLEAHGVQDLKTGAPMSDRSIFRIYSMTKAVTAVAVMRLHEEGRFQLTDPVSKYLQEFKDVSVVAQDGVRTPTRDMTIRDLLLHTSGLDHRTSESYRRARVRSRTMPTAQVVSNIARLPLREDPGTRWRYSESPTVLGRLVEVWSGKALDEFLDEKLFRPLRMVDTGFWARPAQVPRLTTVHTPTAVGGLEPLELEEVPVTERPALLEGAVGLLSTLIELLLRHEDNQEAKNDALKQASSSGYTLCRTTTARTATSPSRWSRGSSWHHRPGEDASRLQPRRGEASSIRNRVGPPGGPSRV